MGEITAIIVLCSSVFFNRIYLLPRDKKRKKKLQPGSYRGITSVTVISCNGNEMPLYKKSIIQTYGLWHASKKEKLLDSITFNVCMSPRKTRENNKMEKKKSQPWCLQMQPKPSDYLHQLRQQQLDSNWSCHLLPGRTPFSNGLIQWALALTTQPPTPYHI